MNTNVVFIHKKKKKVFKNIFFLWFELFVEVNPVEGNGMTRQTFSFLVQN